MDYINTFLLFVIALSVLGTYLKVSGYIADQKKTETDELKQLIKDLKAQKKD